MPLLEIRACRERAGLCQVRGSALRHPPCIPPVQNQGCRVAVIGETPPDARGQESIAAVVHLTRADTFSDSYLLEQLLRQLLRQLPRSSRESWPNKEKTCMQHSCQMSPITAVLVVRQVHTCKTLDINMWMWHMSCQKPMQSTHQIQGYQK